MVLLTAACFDVLITRIELEQVSEIADAENPMTAERSNRLGSSSYWGMSSLRVLYCTTNTQIDELSHAYSSQEGILKYEQFQLNQVL